MTTDVLSRQERWRRLAPRLRDLYLEVGREMEERLRPLGLTKPQAGVLNHLDPDGEGMPIVALAQELACHSSNLTGVLDRLEARGAVRRAPHPLDRRVKVVRLTRVGAELRAAALVAMAAPPLALEALDDEDLAELEALLARRAGAGPRG